MNKRVLLVAPESNLAEQLESAGFQVMTWPKFVAGPPGSFAALDQALGNLYGYDWILFLNPDAVHFFLERLTLQSREVSELDAVRVCALGEATAAALEHARVHVDIVAGRTDPPAILEQLSAYAGGTEHLDRLSFLLPQAAIGRDYLKEHLEEVGARADVVTAYQTVANDDLLRLASLRSMLLTGSVDAVVFSDPREVSELGRVFDINNLGALLRNNPVFTSDDATTKASEAHGISKPVSGNASSPGALNELLAKHFDV